MADEFVQERRFDEVCLLGDERFLSQHHLLRGGRVRRQQPPVDVAAVAQVRVVAVLLEVTQKSVTKLTSQYDDGSYFTDSFKNIVC